MTASLRWSDPTASVDPSAGVAATAQHDAFDATSPRDDLATLPVAAGKGGLSDVRVERNGDGRRGGTDAKSPILPVFTACRTKLDDIQAVSAGGCRRTVTKPERVVHHRHRVLFAVVLVGRPHNPVGSYGRGGIHGRAIAGDDEDVRERSDGRFDEPRRAPAS